MRYILFILFSMMCVSCSLFSPIKVKPSQTYLLTEIPFPNKSYHKHRVVLAVTAPEVDAAYRTAEMAYSIRPHQIAYFGQNRWAVTPSQLLQPLIIQTLLETHYFKAVVSPGLVGQYDYVLRTQLLELLQDFNCHPALYRIKLNAELIKSTSNHIVASKQFSVEVPVFVNNPYAGVRAANHGTVILLEQLREFVMRQFSLFSSK